MSDSESQSQISSESEHSIQQTKKSVKCQGLDDSDSGWYYEDPDAPKSGRANYYRNYGYEDSQESDSSEDDSKAGILMDVKLCKYFRRSQKLMSDGGTSGNESPITAPIVFEDPGEISLPNNVLKDQTDGFWNYSNIEAIIDRAHDKKSNKKICKAKDAYRAAGKVLSSTLTEIKTFGSFATANIFRTFPQPGIVLKASNKHLPLPLDSSGVDRLKEVCEIAPFGKGTETIVDTAFRNCWQVGPEGFSITSPDWSEFLVGLLPDLKRDLGIEPQCIVELELYKLLAYETGCFFKPHKDSEKTERMIGTMVMVLPSVYKGGELIVSHGGEEKVFDFSELSPHYIQYAAFYADCTHEVKEVTEGSRICLVYNILLKNSSSAVPSPVTDETCAKVIEAVEKLKARASKTKNTFLYVLDHYYTPQSLCLDLLKRNDWAIAMALQKAVRKVSCKLYLANLDAMAQVEQGDNAEGDDDRCALRLSNVVTPSGKKLEGALPFKIADDFFKQPLFPTGKLAKCKFHEKWSGDFGNSAVYEKQFYHVTVLVLHFNPA